MSTGVDQQALISEGEHGPDEAHANRYRRDARPRHRRADRRRRATGLTLAAALTARGVRTTVIDRLPEGANTSRAAVVHARTLEVLDALGVSERLAGLGVHARRFTIRDRDRVLVPIDFRVLPTRYPYTLMVSQAVTEGVLLHRFVELGGRALRPRALADLAQDAHGVTATLDDGSTLRARYVEARMACTVSSASVRASRSRAAVMRVVRVGRRATVRWGAVRRSNPHFSPAGLMVVAPLPGGVHRIVAPWMRRPSTRAQPMCRRCWTPVDRSASALRCMR